MLTRFLTASLLLTLVACNSHHPGPISQGAQKPVVVVGAIAKRAGVEAAINRNALAQQLAQFIRDEQRFDVPVVGMISQRLGKEAYSTLLQSYTERGLLSSADMEALARAELGADFAVFARLESDEISFDEPKNEAVYDNQGQRLTDRSDVVSYAHRTTTITALMVDLRTGGTVWHNNFTVPLTSKNLYTNYSGSSFAGSLMATFSNTIANGLRAPRPPDAPSITKAMQALLLEVAQKL